MQLVCLPLRASPSGDLLPEWPPARNPFPVLSFRTNNLFLPFHQGSPAGLSTGAADVQGVLLKTGSRGTGVGRQGCSFWVPSGALLNAWVPVEADREVSGLARLLRAARPQEDSGGRWAGRAARGPRAARD